MKTIMATDNMPFASDPAFCPFCGLILPLPGMVEKVVCRLCGHKQDAEIYEDHVEYTVKYYSIEKKKRRDKQLNSQSSDSGPLAERKCPKCGNEQMTYTTQQTRSADEGQTVFYTCPSCKFKETENS